MVGQPGRGGRPVGTGFKPTATQRREVEEMVSCGMSHDAIAVAIGISDVTLRAHFADNLKHGLYRRRKEIIALLYKSARKGSIPAQRTLGQMLDTTSGAAPPDEKGTPADRPSARIIPLGKKDQAKAEAETAGLGTD